EVPRGAELADIKRAYRALAVRHHPDKGGDPEKFKELTLAFEALSDMAGRSGSASCSRRGSGAGSVASFGQPPDCEGPLERECAMLRRECAGLDAELRRTQA
ncbi:unnamed protein product, partial [Prorocentrum cordatum]